MKCQCEQCSDTPALTYTEQYRHRTECKAVAKRFYLDEKGFEKYMKGVLEKSGFERANRLRNGVKWLWDRYEGRG